MTDNAPALYQDDEGKWRYNDGNEDYHDDRLVPEPDTKPDTKPEPAPLPPINVTVSATSAASASAAAKSNAGRGGCFGVLVLLVIIGIIAGACSHNNNGGSVNNNLPSNLVCVSQGGTLPGC